MRAIRPNRDGTEGESDQSSDSELNFLSSTAKDSGFGGRIPDPVLLPEKNPNTPSVHEIVARTEGSHYQGVLKKNGGCNSVLVGSGVTTGRPDTQSGSSPALSEHLPSPQVTQILEHSYEGRKAFQEVNRDAELLISEVNMSQLSQMPAEDMFRNYRESLIAEARQFVTDSKLLVSSATQSKDKLTINVNNSIHTLARIVDKYQGVLSTMVSSQQANNLGAKVKDVISAYAITVNAAEVAAGMPLSDPNMKMLMRQATTLAAILSSFMRTLKLLECR